MTSKVKEWLKRYLPAEILSTAATIIAGAAVYYLWHRHTLMALAATWAGNVVYFGYIFLNDVAGTTRLLNEEDKRYTAAYFLKNIRAFAVEFGIAEVLDSFLIRPLLMYYLPMLTHNIVWGIILAKIIADITFYVPAIISYEYAKKHFRDTTL